MFLVSILEDMAALTSARTPNLTQLRLKKVMIQVGESMTSHGLELVVVNIKDYYDNFTENHYCNPIDCLVRRGPNKSYSKLSGYRARLSPHVLGGRTDDLGKGGGRLPCPSAS